jgi:hypothetical protein
MIKSKILKAFEFSEVTTSRSHGFTTVLQAHAALDGMEVNDLGTPCGTGSEWHDYFNA